MKEKKQMIVRNFNLKDIKIKEDFKRTPPNKYKMKRKWSYYRSDIFIRRSYNKRSARSYGSI